MEYKLQKIKVKKTKWNTKEFWFGGFWCFVLNDSGSVKTVLKPTDKSLEYFHLINIQNDKVITPICGVISRLELSEHFNFEKPSIWI